MMRPQRRWSPNKCHTSSSSSACDLPAACDDSPTSITALHAVSSHSNLVSSLSSSLSSSPLSMKRRRKGQGGSAAGDSCHDCISLLGRRLHSTRILGRLLTATLRLGALCWMLSYLRWLPSWQPERPQEQRATANVDGVAVASITTTATAHTVFQQSLAQIAPALATCDAITADQVSFTLVTQCSEDRLWMMQHHCQRWAVDNPESLMSLVVYTNMTLISAKQRLMEYDCPVDTGLQVQVLSRSHGDEDYPVNTLRNMAFSVVTTTHAAYVDIDFWESTDLYSILQSPLVRDRLAASYKHALVVPAFQLRRQCHAWKECPHKNIPLMPTTKATMIPFLLNRTITAFDPTNFGGHGSTRYVDWVDQTADELLAIDCVKSNRYEPYLVVRVCRDLPPFQPAFTGYGKNKMTWIMQLRRLGYTLDQLGHAFVVHYPHLDSKARLMWNGGPRGAHLKKPVDESSYQSYKRGQTDQTFIEFRNWLEQTLDDKTEVFKCEEHLDDDARLWVARSKKEEEEDSEDDEDEEDAVGPVDIATS